MSKGLKNLYLICGDEEYLKLEKKNELLSLAGAENSINFNEYSGKDTDLSELSAITQTMPFMQEKRTVLLSETGFFKGAAPEEAKAIAEALPDSTVLIFFENEAEAGNRLYKLVKEKGEIFKFVKPESLSFKEAAEEQRRVKERIFTKLEKEGRRISGRTLNSLLELTGYDLFNINNELEKLISYTEDTGGCKAAAEITEKDIDEICSKTISDRVFDMLSAKISGDTKKALLLFEEMISIKTAPMKILFMLEKQFNQVYVLKELLGKNEPESSIAEKMEIKPWLVKRLREQSAKLRREDARRYLEKAVELETAVKQGDMNDRTAVELLLIM